MTFRLLAGLCAATIPLSACAQRAPGRVADGQPGVQRALAALKADNEWTLGQQISICEIPAPPFKEARRAEEFRRRLEQLGLQGARIDAEGNVIATRAGRAPGGPTVVFSAHLDTVFPETTDVRVTREGTVLRGPGIGDDCRGLAVLLAVARVMQRERIEPAATIHFVGTVGEEGEGNLRGVRHLFTKEMPGQIDYFISVDGTGLGLVNAAVGSKRFRVSYVGPGGHSYGAFGMANPIHAMGRAIAAISELRVPREPRTSFNVGVVKGGTSVNSIAMSGTMDIDMRSESPAALEELDTKVQAALRRALEEERRRWPDSKASLDLKVDTIGIRPAGTQPDTARIVRVARATASRLGFTPSVQPSSTDANIPISLGIPAITIDGGGEGTGAHSLSESYDDGSRGWLGPQWALLILLSL